METITGSSPLAGMMVRMITSASSPDRSLPTISSDRKSPSSVGSAATELAAPSERPLTSMPSSGSGSSSLAAAMSRLSRSTLRHEFQICTPLNSA